MAKLLVLCVLATLLAFATAATTVGSYSVFADRECSGAKPPVSADACVGCACATNAASPSSTPTCSFMASTSFDNADLRTAFCAAVRLENAGPTQVMDDAVCVEKVGAKPGDGCWRCEGRLAAGSTDSVVVAAWVTIRCPTTTCACGLFPPAGSRVVSCETDSGAAGHATLMEQCVTGATADSCTWARSPCEANANTEPTPAGATTGGDGGATTSGPITECHCASPLFTGLCDDGTPKRVDTETCVQNDDGTCQYRLFCERTPTLACDCPELSAQPATVREPLLCADGTTRLPLCNRELEGDSAVCNWEREDCPEPPTTNPCATATCEAGRRCVEGHCVRPVWSYVLTFDAALDDNQRAALEEALPVELASRLSADAEDFTVVCASNAALGRTSCVITAPQNDDQGNDTPVEPRDTNASDDSEVQGAAEASATATGTNAALLSATPNSSGNSSTAATLVALSAALLVALVALLL